jgi:hypothetical protein
MVDSEYESSDYGEPHSEDGSNWVDDDDYEEEIDEGGDDTEMVGHALYLLVLNLSFSDMASPLDVPLISEQYTAIRDDESDEGPTDSYTFWPLDAGDM